MKILYDGEPLLNALKKNSSRSGIFWVSFNILKNLLQIKDLKISLYFNNFQSYYSYKKNEEKFKNFFNLECINDTLYSKNFINKIKNISTKYEKFLELKNNSKNIISKFIFNLLKSLYKNKLKKIEKKYRKNLNYNIDFDFYISTFLAFPDIVKHNNKIKKIIILYDTIPLIFPEFYKDNSHYMKILESLDKDTYCFCISEQTKKDFLKYCGDKLDENKMFVMPIATSQNFYPDKDETKLNKILDKYNISQNQRGKYIFSLCTLEPRKNLIFTIKCFIKFIKENDIDDLYFYLGGGHWNNFIKILDKEIDNLEEYKNKIVKLGYIDDNDLNTLYSNSLFFAYISLYEGFGMPPLEAMSCGAPVITSNTSSIPEVVGDAAIMIDPNDEKACINAMKELYYNQDLRNELSKKGLEQSKKFTWENTINIILNKINNNMGLK